jgi:hypothetical protein
VQEKEKQEEKEKEKERERSESVISDSYSPHSSYAPRARSDSHSSLGTASESYDSEFPDRVPTPTPPHTPPRSRSPSPPPSPIKSIPMIKLDEKIIRKYSVRGNRWREIGYVAAFVQLLAASVFWISVLTGISSLSISLLLSLSLFLSLSLPSLSLPLFLFLSLPSPSLALSLLPSHLFPLSSHYNNLSPNKFI